MIWFDLFSGPAIKNEIGLKNEKQYDNPLYKIECAFFLFPDDDNMVPSQWR